MAVRFCEQCKQPFQEGYFYDEESYYCSDECLHAALPDLTEALQEELYEEDILYWTEWHSVAPYYNLMEVYTHSDTDALWIYEKDAACNLMFNASIGSVLTSKWILLSSKEEEALCELQSTLNNTSTYYLTHEPFTHPEQRTFNTLELAKQAYLEEEEEN
ncbi:MAG: hypothetical protein ABS939_02380 [Psychrobacillus sp.]